jgi:hypothetical protein
VLVITSPSNKISPAAPQLAQRAGQTLETGSSAKRSDEQVKKRYKHPYQQVSAVLETFETVQLQAALAWLVQALHMEWSKACKED